jgi:hypothetical protein
VEQNGAIEAGVVLRVGDKNIIFLYGDSRALGATQFH